MKIPGEIWLQASWICSSSSSSSTSNEITTRIFRVWHEQDTGATSVYSPECAAKHLQKPPPQRGEIIKSSLNPVIFLPGRSGEVCVICFQRRRGKETQVIGKSYWIATEERSPLRNLRSSLWKATHHTHVYPSPPLLPHPCLLPLPTKTLSTPSFLAPLADHRIGRWNGATALQRAASA